ATTISISTSAVAIAEVKSVKVHTANFITFDLAAVAVGTTTLSASSVTPAIAIAIVIDVENKFILPADSTDEGVTMRVFLAEAQPPSSTSGPAFFTDALESLQLMRVVLENRLAAPAGIFSSTKAKSLADVVKASKPTIQFRDFDKYPKLGAGARTNIQHA